MLLLLTILQSFFSTMEQKTLQSDLTVTIAEQVSQPLSYTGKLTLHGDLFLLNMMDMEAAYDGSTLYVYNTGTDELMLSTPSEEELLEANPMRYAKALQKVCNITERQSKDGLHTYITFTPKDQSLGVQRFVLRLKHVVKADVTTLYPESIEMKEGNKTTTLQFRNPQYITAKTQFILNKPNAFINDLR
ncbi:MAG: outer membrane lipoprotein carrier protein LolA [Paludibacteraceae bacterium]|nr:outer membrane lipoprotein carrier protein LolA [Paludibacteraceae bacterium]